MYIIICMWDYNVGGRIKKWCVWKWDNSVATSRCYSIYIATISILYASWQLPSRKSTANHTKCPLPAESWAVPAWIQLVFLRAPRVKVMQNMWQSKGNAILQSWKTLDSDVFIYSIIFLHVSCILTSLSLSIGVKKTPWQFEPQNNTPYPIPLDWLVEKYPVSLLWVITIPIHLIESSSSLSRVLMGIYHIPLEFNRYNIPLIFNSYSKT